MVLGGVAVSYERGTPGIDTTWTWPRSPLTIEPQGVTWITSPEYRGTALTRKRTPLGPYRRPMPRVLGGS